MNNIASIYISSPDKLNYKKIEQRNKEAKPGTKPLPAPYVISGDLYGQKVYYVELGANARIQMVGVLSDAYFKALAEIEDKITKETAGLSFVKDPKAQKPYKSRIAELEAAKKKMQRDQNFGWGILDADKKLTEWGSWDYGIEMAKVNKENGLKGKGMQYNYSPNLSSEMRLNSAMWENRKCWFEGFSGDPQGCVVKSEAGHFIVPIMPKNTITRVEFVRNDFENKPTFEQNRIEKHKVFFGANQIAGH